MTNSQVLAVSNAKLGTLYVEQAEYEKARQAYQQADFFDFTRYGRTPRTFTPISVSSYAQDCFTGVKTTCGFTTLGLDPDDDAKEDQD